MKDDFGLSKKIKDLRQQKGMTLEQLALKTSFNKSYLSKIENGRNLPPIATLARIAKALEISMASFFKESGEDEAFGLTTVKERIPVARHGNRLGYFYESLNHKKKKKSFDAFLISFPVGADPAGLLFEHEGEEMLFILEGVLKFRYQDREYILRKGDCAHFDSASPHMGQSVGRKEVKALLITCGPK